MRAVMPLALPCGHAVPGWLGRLHSARMHRCSAILSPPRPQGGSSLSWPAQRRSGAALARPQHGWGTCSAARV